VIIWIPDEGINTSCLPTKAYAYVKIDKELARMVEYIIEDLEASAGVDLKAGDLN